MSPINRSREGGQGTLGGQLLRKTERLGAVSGQWALHRDDHSSLLGLWRKEARCWEHTRVLRMKCDAGDL